MVLELGREDGPKLRTSSVAINLELAVLFWVIAGQPRYLFLYLLPAYLAPLDTWVRRTAVTSAYSAYSTPNTAKLKPVFNHQHASRPDFGASTTGLQDVKQPGMAPSAWNGSQHIGWRRRRAEGADSTSVEVVVSRCPSLPFPHSAWGVGFHGDAVMCSALDPTCCIGNTGNWD